MKLLLYLTFFLFSLGQLGRISFMNQEVNIYLYEVSTFILSVCLIIKYKNSPIKWLIKKFKSLIIFFCILFISYFLSFFKFNTKENLVAVLYVFRLVLYFTYFIYVSFFIKEKLNNNLLSNSINLFILGTTISSIIQYFFYNDLRNLIYLGWDPHYYRMFGTFFDTSTAGAIYGLIFLYIYNQQFKDIKHIFSKYLLLLIYFIFIALTFSRSLYLVFVITLSLILFKRKLYKIYLFTITLFIIIVLLIPKPQGEGVNLTRMFSIQSRIENYKEALNYFKKSPLLGVGYNRIRYIRNVDSETHSGASFHSSFLIILVTAGILGLISFIGVLFNLTSYNSFSKIIIIFLSLLSLTDNTLLHPFVLFFLLNILQQKQPLIIRYKS